MPLQSTTPWEDWTFCFRSIKYVRSIARRRRWILWWREPVGVLDVLIGVVCNQSLDHRLSGVHVREAPGCLTRSRIIVLGIVWWWWVNLVIHHWLEHRALVSRQTWGRKKLSIKNLCRISDWIPRESRKERKKATSSSARGRKGRNHPVLSFFFSLFLLFLCDRTQFLLRFTKRQIGVRVHKETPLCQKKARNRTEQWTQQTVQLVMPDRFTERVFVENRRFRVLW